MINFKNYFYILIFLLTCVSCDVTRSLGNGYKLVDWDENHVYIGKASNGVNRIIINEQVVDWKIDGKYIFVLRKVSASPDCLLKNGNSTIITHKNSVEEFWIINSKTDEVFGPLNKNEFKLAVTKLRLELPDLNVPSNYHDNTEEFRNLAAKCVKLQ